MEIEKKIISILSRKGASSACAIGSCSREEKEEISFVLREMGLSNDAILSQIQDLEDELSGYTPWRLRLFRILFKRCCAKNIPILLVPIRHTHEGRIDLGTPEMVVGYDVNKNKMRRIEKDGSVAEKDLSEWVKYWIRENLNPDAMSGLK